MSDMASTLPAAQGSCAVDIRHIRVVLAVLEEGTLSRATSRLGIPQSALSTQISRIERAVGKRLFVRSPRGTKRTEDLERMLPYLRAVDSAMRALEQAMTPDASSVATKFEVGLTSPDFAAPLAAICGQPACTPTTFLVATEDACIKKLCDNKLAFVQLYGMPAIPGELAHNVRVATIGEETLCALLPPGHRLADRLAGGERVGLTDLVDEHWVSYPLRAEQHTLLSALCEAQGFSPRIRYRASTELAARDLVRDHGCVTIGSPGAVRAGITARSLDVQLTRKLVAAWNLSRCSQAIAYGLCVSLRHWYLEHSLVD